MYAVNQQTGQSLDFFRTGSYRHSDPGGAGHWGDGVCAVPVTCDWTKLSNIKRPAAPGHEDDCGRQQRLVYTCWCGWACWSGGLVSRHHSGLLTPRFMPLSREGYMPPFFRQLHPRFKTPHRAILAGGAIGIAAIYSDELIKIGGNTLTANIVTMSVFGAILMYIISMLSLFQLRRTAPNMVRPFRAPFLPTCSQRLHSWAQGLHGYNDLLQTP